MIGKPTSFGVAVVLVLIFGAAAPLFAQEAAAARPGDTLGWHIVRPGETLEAITALYLGTPVLWQENWRLNPGIRNPDLLHIGQRLRVIVHRELPRRMAEVKDVSRRVDEKPHPNPWIAARVGDLLKERDGLRTYRSSSARLRFGDGLEMLITEDSLVFLNQMDADVLGRSRDGIEIVQGQADLKIKRVRKRGGEIEVVAGSARTRPEPNAAGAASSRIARSGDGGAKVMVYTGRSWVASAGDEIQVPQGMGTAIPKGAPPSPPEKLLRAPVLQRPAAGWQVPWANPDLEWKAVDGAQTYVVEVFKDRGGTQLVVRQAQIDATSWTPGKLPVGRLFWRVTAVAPSGLDGYPSQARGIHVLSALPDLEAPVVAVLPLAGVRVAGDHLVALPGGTVRLVAHDDVAGVESVGYRWDDGSWEVAGKGTLRVPEGPGRHELQFRATDRKGRHSKTWSVLVEVNGKGPEAPRIVRGADARRESE